LDLGGLCFDGPEDRLNQTDMCQPAIYVTSVACFRAAEEAGIVSAETTGVYAGLSLGEYTALHLAGVFSFEEGLRLVAARGRFMQEAAAACRGGMVAIIGGDEATVAGLCQEAAEGEVMVPANFNSPGQIVVSGSAGACGRIAAMAEAKGLKAVTLKVAGAFHSPLMQIAADRMKQELEKVALAAPRGAVWANVSASPHTDPEDISRLLVEQIVRPVKWEQTMQALVGGTDLRFVELAPGRTLAGLAKRINRRVAVESLATADALSKHP
jgi:[acyl-carrier-protein] S-malonyltransferase